MKTKFPNLGGFLTKPQAEKKGKNESKPVLDISTAFVYKGHIVATDGRVHLFFNLKEYLKYNMQPDEDEDPSNCMSTIKTLVETLEGKTLSKEFFAVFSKMQTIIKSDEFKIFVENKSLHSEYGIEPEYNIELLEDFLSKSKVVWEIDRTVQGQFGINGLFYNTISSVLKGELSNDAIVFERTSDDKAKFCLIRKEFIFGICQFSTETESSLTKFQEANDFFSVNVTK